MPEGYTKMRDRFIQEGLSEAMAQKFGDVFREGCQDLERQAPQPARHRQKPRREEEGQKGMSTNPEPPPDPLAVEKARQYDIVIEIVEWILASYRQNRSLHAVAPHLTTLGVWYDVQANLGIRAVPGESRETQDGPD